jgi:hypothetical protein
VLAHTAAAYSAHICTLLLCCCNTSATAAHHYGLLLLYVNTTATGILVAAPKFSKYIHGAASLFPDAVPAYPGWFTEDTSTGTMRAITDNELAEGGMQPLRTVRVTRHSKRLLVCLSYHRVVYGACHLSV